MSCVTIYKIIPNGDVVEHSEARNGNAFAPIVWDHFGKKLNLLSSDFLHKYDNLWQSWPVPGLSRTENILLGSTFNGAWITYALIPDLIYACERFYAENVKGKLDERAFVGIIDSLKQIYNDPTNRGTAFCPHSVSPSFWLVRDVCVGDDEYEDRSYNIDHDKEHPARGEYAGYEAWELSEALGKYEKTRREAAAEQAIARNRDPNYQNMPNAEAEAREMADYFERHCALDPRSATKALKRADEILAAHKEHKHYSQKCERCLKCPRCSNNNNRNGSLQLTFWTPTGPWSMFLCGDCAKVVRKALNLVDDIFAEESGA